MGAVVLPRSTNPEFRDYPRRLPHDSFIHRGYLRLLHKTFEYASEFAGKFLDASSLSAKLNFQFNPNQLTRSVTARSDTQLWINQSPTQLLQPAIGDMTFEWTMLFNREAEVSSNLLSSTERSWEDLSTSALDHLLDPAAAVPQALLARRLGVLADIAVLDRITGQSITKEAVDYARNRHDVIAEAGLSEEDDPVNTDNFTIQISERYDEDNNNIIDANAHNAAFLIPNPIRAVFSENFMVDGYVNSVIVSFQKFSPEMIPTVAVVDISMHAIYQGFTRQKTIFTDLLRLQALESGTINPEGGDHLGSDEVAPDLTVALALQELGAVQPAVLTGIQHTKENLEGVQVDQLSPDLNDIIKFKGGERDQFMFRYDYDFRPYTAYTPFERGGTESGLAAYLHRMEDTDNPVIQELVGTTAIGLSLRARLKVPDSVGDAAAKKAQLNLLVGGNDAGMNDGIDLDDAFLHTDAFFVDWEQGQRKLLFGVGIDNLGESAEIQTTLYEEFAADGNFYTRSFPIINIPRSPSGVGDHLGFGEESSGTGMFSHEYTSVKDVDEGFPNQRQIVGEYATWKKEDTVFRLASGFFSTLGVSLPEQVTLQKADLSTKVYDVEYQMKILFRHFLYYPESSQTNFHFQISDSGWLVVYPLQPALLGGRVFPELEDTLLAGDVVDTGLISDRDFPWFDNQDLPMVFTGDATTSWAGNVVAKPFNTDWYWIGETDEATYVPKGTP